MEKIFIPGNIRKDDAKKIAEQIVECLSKVSKRDVSLIKLATDKMRAQRLSKIDRGIKK